MYLENGDRRIAFKKDGLCVDVLIPSYDRPELLGIILRTWLNIDYLGSIFVLAQASSQEVANRYKSILEEFGNKNRVVYKILTVKLGSVRARNMLLDMASESSCEYVLMTEDDLLPLDRRILAMMIKRFKLDNRIGLVGGKVSIISKRRVDPEFFLNLPLNLTELISKLTGYIFVNAKRSSGYSEYLFQYFLIKKEVLAKGVRYSEFFNIPTGFREETDFQFQVKNLGYMLFYESKVNMIHLTIETGGNRPGLTMGERMYWKARAHTLFVLKWNKSILKRVWYITCSLLILSLYRPWHIPWILKGVKDGIRIYYEKVI